MDGDENLAKEESASLVGPNTTWNTLGERVNEIRKPPWYLIPYAQMWSIEVILNLVMSLFHTP